MPDFINPKQELNNSSDTFSEDASGAIALTEDALVAEPIRSPGANKSGMGMKKSVLYTALGYGAYAACNFVMGMLMAKAGQDNLGTYGTALKLTDPFLVFAGLNLRSLYVADVLKGFDLEDYIGTRFITFIVSLILIIFWAKIIMPSDSEIVIFSVVFAAGNVFDGIADTYCGIYQKKQRLDLLALSQIFRGVLSLGLFCVFFFGFHHSLILGIGGSSLASLITLLGFDFIVASFLETRKWLHFVLPKFNFKKIVGVIYKAGPLTFSVFLDSFTLAYPMTMVASIMGMRANTPLQTYNYLINFGQIFVTGIVLTISPKFGEFVNSDQRESYFKLLKWAATLIFVGSTLLTAMAYFLGGIFIKILFRKTFVVEPDLFALIMIGGALRYGTTLVGIALTSAKWLNGQVLWALPSFIAVLLTGSLLVKSDGLYGAAYATIIATGLKFGIGCVILYSLGDRWNNRLTALQATT